MTEPTAETETPGIDALREHVRILAGMLNDPEPGLFTWRQAIYERIQAIKQFGLSPLDHAAPDLLAACKRLYERLDTAECLYGAEAIQAGEAIAKAEGQ